MNLVVLAVLLTAHPQLEILASQPVTITGPITGTPSFLSWTPAPTMQPGLPLPTVDTTLWLGIAWYWIKSTWLDNRLFGYWIIYQVATIALGQFIGAILSKGSLRLGLGNTLRLVEARMSAHEPEPEPEAVPEEQPEQPEQLEWKI